MADKIRLAGYSMKSGPFPSGTASAVTFVLFLKCRHSDNLSLARMTQRVHGLLAHVSFPLTERMPRAHIILEYGPCAGRKCYKWCSCLSSLLDLIPP